MLFGSYMAGSVPLFMPMSESNLHLVSVMGAGLLVGVAFAVIVPEGMQTLIKAYQLKDKTMHGKKNFQSYYKREFQNLSNKIKLQLKCMFF